MSLILKMLGRKSEELNEKIAIDDGVGKITYAELYKEVKRVGEFINEKDFPKYPLILTQNSIQGIVLFFSLVVTNRVPALGDPSWKESDIKKVVDYYDFSCVMIDQRLPKAGECIDEIEGFDVFEIAKTDVSEEVMDRNLSLYSEDFIRFTSGSSGVPKALVFPIEAAFNASERWSKNARYKKEDRVLCLSVINNGLAFNTSILPALIKGASIYLMQNKLLPSLIKQRYLACKPTVFVAFPFIYESIYKRLDKTDIESTRLFVSSAAKLEKELEEKWFDKFSNPVLNYYGVAELGPVTFNNNNSYSLGKVCDDVALKVEGVKSKELSGEIQKFNPGQLKVKTNSMAYGYLNQKRSGITSLKLDCDGYFITSDIGYVESNALHLTGRIDNIINVAGKKFYPSEITSCVETMCGVKDVEVRVFNSLNQNRIELMVESETLTETEIRQFCVKNLASYKIPNSIKIYEKFPRSSTGKKSLFMMEN